MARSELGGNDAGGVELDGHGWFDDYRHPEDRGEEQGEEFERNWGMMLDSLNDFAER